MMKRILTLIACAIALSAGAQIPYEFPYNPDADNDAFISTTDLVEFLALFGQNFTSEELYLSDDSSRMILKVGDLMHTVECMSACMHLEGSWHVADRNDVLYFHEFLTEGLNAYESHLGIAVEDTEGLEVMWVRDVGGLVAGTLTPFRKNLTLGEDGDGNIVVYHAPFTVGLNPNSDSDMPVERNRTECWCATQQRPRVEYSVVEANSGSWNGILNSMAEQGWLLLPQGPFGNQITFWRWAD